MYITGIILHLYYSIYYHLLPIFIPTVIELCLIIFLFTLKIYYQKIEGNIVEKEHPIENDDDNQI